MIYIQRVTAAVMLETVKCEDLSGGQ